MRLPQLWVRLVFMRESFVAAIFKHQAAFGIQLSQDKVTALADHYDLVIEDNDRLHLVAPCSPDEFATRHVLESLTLLKFLPENTRIVDVGTGSGLPLIPCLIVRPDLFGYLIESKQKKAAFLDNVVTRCGLSDRAEVINKQFAEVQRPDVSFVTCRALDKFTEKLTQILKWSGDAKLLLFGGPALRDAMNAKGIRVETILLPLSEQRYLLVSES